MTTAKTMITTLIFAAAVATPAMASGFRQSGAIAPAPGFAYNETATGKTYRAPTSTVHADSAYDAYAYAPDITGSIPPGAMSGVVWHNGRYIGADPDPDVRLQLQNQASLIDR